MAKACPPTVADQPPGTAERRGSRADPVPLGWRRVARNRGSRVAASGVPSRTAAAHMARVDGEVPGLLRRPSGARGSGRAVRRGADRGAQAEVLVRRRPRPVARPPPGMGVIVVKVSPQRVALRGSALKRNVRMAMVHGGVAIRLRTVDAGGGARRGAARGRLAAGWLAARAKGPVRDWQSVVPLLPRRWSTHQRCR